MESLGEILVMLALSFGLLALHLPLVLLDLRRQPIAVSPLWAAPTLLALVPWGLLLVLAWLGTAHPLAARSTLFQGALGTLVLVAVSSGAATTALAFSRWLAPGGLAPWRPGVSVLGSLVVLGLFLPWILLSPDLPLGDLVLALPFFTLALLFGRHGTERVQVGARAAASAGTLAVGSFVLLLTGSMWFEPGETSSMIAAAAVFALLLGWGCLRAPPSLWVFALLGAEAVLLGSTTLLASTGSAFPSTIGAPLAEDWWAEPTDQFDAEVACFVLAGAGTRFGACDTEPPALVLDAVATTATLAAERRAHPELQGLALGRGDALLRFATDPPAVPDVTVVDGRPHYRGHPVTRDVLRAHPPREPLWFEASDALSVLQFVRFCATATTGERCGVMPGR